MNATTNATATVIAPASVVQFFSDHIGTFLATITVLVLANIFYFSNPFKNLLASSRHESSTSSDASSLDTETVTGTEVTKTEEPTTEDTADETYDTKGDIETEEDLLTVLFSSLQSFELTIASKFCSDRISAAFYAAQNREKIIESFEKYGIPTDQEILFTIDLAIEKGWRDLSRKKISDFIQKSDDMQHSHSDKISGFSTSTHSLATKWNSAYVANAVGKLMRELDTSKYENTESETDVQETEE